MELLVANRTIVFHISGIDMKIRRGQCTSRKHKLFQLIDLDGNLTKQSDVEDVADVVRVEVVDDVGSDHCKRSITCVKRCIALSVINIVLDCNCARYVEPYGKRLAE
ncbi:unnamed protein product [Rotaria magnacalcarata]